MRNISVLVLFAAMFVVVGLSESINEDDGGAQVTMACRPWTVRAEDQCSYVMKNKEACYPEGGFLAYLKVHYCAFSRNWRWVSILLLSASIVVLFGVLLTTAEQFFCPALELIADYLRLPPAVTGATLVALGNSAPDIFTQVAAVQQDAPSSTAMALSEPLGGGLFGVCVVFGCVILLSSKHHQVLVNRSTFLKDVIFFLGSVTFILYFLIRGEVYLWQTGALACMYLTYVGVTIYLARHDEPLHVELDHHEIPEEEMVGGVDDISSESGGDNLDTIPAELDVDEEQGLKEPLLSCDKASDELEEDQLPSLVLSNSGSVSGIEPFAGQNHVTSRPALDEGDQQYVGREEEPATLDKSPMGHCSPHSNSPEGSRCGNCGMARPWKLDSSEVLVFEEHQDMLLCSSPKVEAYSGAKVPGQPRTAKNKGALSAPAKDNHQDSSFGILRFKQRLERPIVHLLSFTMPRVSAHSHGRHYSAYKAMLLPFIIPLTLTWAIFGYEWLQVVQIPPMAAFLLSASLGSLVILTTYPRDAVPRGPLRGAFAVMTFILAIVWLNQAAQGLVRVCLVIGRILGVNPSLLGGTVLAWGNSAPDLVIDTSMARDGFPTVALTACFAAPLLTLLAGSSTSLTVGVLRHGGALLLPTDGSLFAMYGFMLGWLLGLLLAVPWLFGYRLGKRVAVCAFLYYVSYITVYILFQLDII